MREFLIERENDCLLLMKNGEPRWQQFARSVLAFIRGKEFITRRQAKALRKAVARVDECTLLTAAERAALRELEEISCQIEGLLD